MATLSLAVVQRQLSFLDTFGDGTESQLSEQQREIEELQQMIKELEMKIDAYEDYDYEDKDGKNAKHNKETERVLQNTVAIDDPAAKGGDNTVKISRDSEGNGEPIPGPDNLHFEPVNGQGSPQDNQNGGNNSNGNQNQQQSLPPIIVQIEMPEEKKTHDLKDDVKKVGDGKDDEDDDDKKDGKGKDGDDEDYDDYYYDDYYDEDDGPEIVYVPVAVPVPVATPAPRPVQRPAIIREQPVTRTEYVVKEQAPGKLVSSQPGTTVLPPVTLSHFDNY